MVQITLSLNKQLYWHGRVIVNWRTGVGKKSLRLEFLLLYYSKLYIVDTYSRLILFLTSHRRPNPSKESGGCLEVTYPKVIMLMILWNQISNTWH